MWKVNPDIKPDDLDAADLLALKLVVENIDPRTAVRVAEAEAACEGGASVTESAQPVTVRRMEEWLRRAASRGLIEQLPSLIRRDPPTSPAAHLASPGTAGGVPGKAWGGGPSVSDRFRISSTFVLQWHITNACDLACTHCYDRTRRGHPTLRQALDVLDDLYSFCRKHHVWGHVCFTGGNPLMHPDFLAMYQAAADFGYSVSILGNATTSDMLDRIAAIRAPEYYQVSLEGTEQRNDEVRGAGYFRRVLGFLPLLKERGIPSHVMLTLTRDNMQDVLPLAERLAGGAGPDSLTFNRLSRSGSGACLSLPDPIEYRAFLDAYQDAQGRSDVLSLKDNLLNLARLRAGKKPFGGCTGFGCGAAFNFVSLLPDGEVHACRKFSSLIGNVYFEGLDAIYHSEAAARYREGPKECAGCALRPVCGGCMAVTRGQGLDPLVARDPFCDITPEEFAAGFPA